MYQAQSFDHLRSLAGMSDGQIAEHLELYAGYVKQVNELTKELADMHNEKKVAGKDFGLAEATRRLAYEYDGMVLHEHYFSNLKPGGAPRPTERQPCGRALAQAYGSIERWQENFKALGGMRGVGWVILFQDPQNGSLTNYWVSLHQDGIPARCTPLLVWTCGSTPSCVTTAPRSGSATSMRSSRISTGRPSSGDSTRGRLSDRPLPPDDGAGGGVSPPPASDQICISSR
jgi:superoxide dismutase, Fe-Mn family